MIRINIKKVLVTNREWPLLPGYNFNIFIIHQLSCYGPDIVMKINFFGILFFSLQIQMQLHLSGHARTWVWSSKHVVSSSKGL